jgi:hypothetical protein
LPEYIVPDTSELDEDHVRSALDFLIAVEPDPPPESREGYEAATEPYRQQIAAAMATLRAFAEQTQPMTSEQMQADYYGFTNDPRWATQRWATQSQAPGSGASVPNLAGLATNVAAAA